MATKLIPAPIDEKNVCTDWIEEVFDNLRHVESGKQAVGFVNDAPVYVSWYENQMTFLVVEHHINRYEETRDEIAKRLKELFIGEDDAPSGLNVRLTTGRNFVHVRFFFVDD